MVRAAGLLVQLCRPLCAGCTLLPCAQAREVVKVGTTVTHNLRLLLRQAPHYLSLPTSEPQMRTFLVCSEEDNPIFFSPASFPYAKSLLMSYGGVACDAPDPDSLQLLVGNPDGAWQVFE